MRTIQNTDKGIGLRSEHIELLARSPKQPDIDFLELAPENWMSLGGLKREQLQDIAKQYPLIAHGLSLSIGDCQPLNTKFVRQVGQFLDELNIQVYSEHLSFSRDSQGYLYELLPVPRRAENIGYLADRIKQVQDIIQRPLVMENISYYHNYGDEMPEGEFIAEIAKRSGCELLVDINNLYVNSQNHHFDASQMLKALPSDAIRYYHIAGHLVESDRSVAGNTAVESNKSLLDTHGMEVQQEVIDLARYVFDLHGSKPLLLERDNNVPPLVVLSEELRTVHRHVLNAGVAHRPMNQELVYA
ncbi:hypothetical protein BCU85_16770 [Vibrio lentus]|uniref:DUF692 domain-containing protein n=1 Tax=Vibrio lentus TaxID=136468 RepID=UPI000C863840|nr:DUF692 domain-containing protein [Vibrio lentus]MCC4817011.1 DUF692 domain-containing protein [Vibrio lentus]PMG73489.1 hypothetical protein BCU85_16770 [Vibrio lentus]PMK91807.1 hypothetical protein BCT88_01275 [Vibrio lentus]PML22830.1 hypothetical protein BCT80_07930 [Vibrio lentus]PMM29573.1 hypothetical protein BCT57_00190 [Vibrio lentus]